MVDFRYHIVSLVAVFLALAVGIILGAGPLQNSIGDTLSGEVGVLRESNADLKTANEQLADENEHYVAAFNQFAPTLLEGTLAGQSIAIVTFPGTADEDLEKVQDQATQAGATVSGVFDVQSAWTDAKSSAYRSSFAEQIKTYVSEADKESDANKIMALALNQIIRAGVNAEANKVLSELMTSADTVMLKVREGGAAASSAVIFLSPDMPDLTPQKDTTQDPDKVAQAEYDAKTFNALVDTVGQKSPTVLGGYANSQNDLVMLARTGNINVSSVDTMNSPLGATNAVLAVAAELQEQKVTYGFADGVDAIVGKRLVVPEAQKPAEEESAESAEKAASE